MMYYCKKEKCSFYNLERNSCFKIDPIVGDINEGIGMKCLDFIDVEFKSDIKEELLVDKEMVEHPNHYNSGKYEVIDVIDDWKLGFYEGNIIKYVARAKHKANELEDLKKAKFYLDRLIELKGE